MRRRIILIVVILGVVGILASGIWWYVHSNSGQRLLSRVDLALHAQQYDKAGNLAESYIAKYPGDWQGYYLRAIAYNRMGKYPEARQQLDRILSSPGQMNCDEVAVRVQRSETYAQPVRHSTVMKEVSPQESSLQSAFAGMNQAVTELEPLQNVQGKGRLDVLESVAMNLIDMATISRRWARLQQDASQTARKVADQAKYEALRSSSKENLSQAEQYDQRATQILLELVANDASRDEPAKALVELCLRRKDRESLEQARKAITALSDPPPMAAAILAIEEADSSAAGKPAAARQRLQAAASKLDAILQKHADILQVKVYRADVALKLRDDALVERLCAEIVAKDFRNPKAHMIHASLLMQQGKMAEAEAELFTLQDSRLPDAHYAYGRAALANGKKELAASAMRMATQIEPLHAPARRYMAISLRDQGFFDQAFEDAKMYLQASPSDPVAIKLFTDLANKTDQPALAREMLQNAATEYKDRPEVIIAVAEGYSILGDNPQAQQTIQSLAASMPSGDESVLAAARALMLAGQAVQAEKMLLDLLAKNDSTPQAEAHHMLAQVYGSLGRLGQAVEQYRAAAQAEPANETYQVDLARSLLNRGDLDECAAVLQAVEQSNPAANVLRLQLQLTRGEAADPLPILQQAAQAGQSGLPVAISCLSSGQVQQCIDICLAELQKSGAQKRDVRILLARAYQMAGQRDQCVGQLKELIASAPLELPMYLTLAGLLAQDAQGILQGDVEAVADELKKVPQAVPHLVDFARAWLLDRLAKYDQAAACYEKLADQTAVPEDARRQARLLQAQELARSGQSDKALAVLDRMISQKESIKTAMFVKVQLLASLQRTDEARNVLANLRDIALKDKDTAVMGGIIARYSAIGSHNEAIATCDQLRQMAPEGSQPHLLKARVLLQAGRGEEAVASFESAVNKDPANIQVYVEMAEVLDRMQKLPEALAITHRMAKLGPSGEAAALSQRATILARLGLRSQAVACFEELAKLGYSRNARLQLALGQALASMGQKQQAAKVLGDIPAYAPQYVPAQRALAASADGLDAQLKILADLNKARPGLAEVVHEQMNLMLSADRADDAIACFNAYIEHIKGRPLSAEIAFTAVTAMLQKGDVKRASALAETLSSQANDTRWRKLAALLQAEVSPQSAASRLVDPERADAYDVLLGICLTVNADPPAAAMWNERLSQISQHLAKANRSLPVVPGVLVGLTFAKQPQAADDLKKAKGIDTLMRLALGELISSSTDAAKASAEAAALLKAAMALELGLPKLAHEWAMASLSARPTCQLAALLAISSKKDIEGQKKILQSVQPADCTFARLAMAQLLMRQRQYEPALRLLEQMPGEALDHGLMMERSVALENLGRFDEALSVYRQVWAETKDPAAANNAAYMISLLHPKDPDKLKEARAMLDKAIASIPDSSSCRETSGWVTYLQGQPQKACLELRQATKGMPDSPEAHYHAGLAEIAGGDKELGRYHLEAAVQLGQKLQQDGSSSPAIDRAAAEAKKALESLTQQPQ